MPKKTINDYTFYKIINVNSDVDLCYVGSTVDMKGRTRQHKSNCNYVNGPKYNLKVYKTIREHGGWDEFKMIPVCYAEQLTLTEAHVIEEKYRVELCAELNTNRCHITEEQLKDRVVNKELNRKNSMIRHQKNRDENNERSRLYRQNNKVKLRANASAKNTCECGCVISHDSLARHRRTQNHIDLMNNKIKNEIKTGVREKITCECGCVVCRGDISTHRKTKKHIDLMNNKNNIEVIHNE